MFYFEDDDKSDCECGEPMSTGSPGSGPRRQENENRSASLTSRGASGGMSCGSAPRTNANGVPLYTPPHLRMQQQQQKQQQINKQPPQWRTVLAPANPLNVKKTPTKTVPVQAATGAQNQRQVHSEGGTRRGVAAKLAGSPSAKRGRARPVDNMPSTFSDLYTLKADVLGQGSYASVRACVSNVSGAEYAVKIIEKRDGYQRSRVMKEIETFNACAGHPNIVHLVEFFEESDRFYLIFEKMRGGPLLAHVQRRIYFTEQEAALVTRNIANALKFLHGQGIAHRDVKPENVLCVYPDRVSPVKLCDLDLASKLDQLPASLVKTPELQSPVGSAEFMAPEVVDAFVGESLRYDKRCDMWSLGVIIYIMLCGYPPFYGECARQNCGWDQGLNCSDCQESLFARIQLGEFEFPADDWVRVSDSAKDLIAKLLVKDAKQRLTADQVLRHPWVNDEAPRTPLLTPDVLLRNDSARDLHQMQENFNALGRMAVVERLSGRKGHPYLPIARLTPSGQASKLMFNEALLSPCGGGGKSPLGRPPSAASRRKLTGGGAAGDCSGHQLHQLSGARVSLGHQPPCSPCQDRPPSRLNSQDMVATVNA